MRADKAGLFMITAAISLAEMLSSRDMLMRLLTSAGSTGRELVVRIRFSISCAVTWESFPRNHGLSGRNAAYPAFLAGKTISYLKFFCPIGNFRKKD